jgi:carboxylesterase
MQAFAQAFAGEHHRPFVLNGGAPAALLIHGFPGTPAEMRPIAQSLHHAGWTAHGLLLPGFGLEIETLADRTHNEWLAAVHERLATLRRTHSPVVLVGLSMGGALALAAAAENPPDGVVLAAPFWRLENPLWTMLPALRLVFPQFRPFSLMKPDFKDPEVRKGITQYMPGIDLDDPQVQRGIREFSIPTRIFHEIRQAGMLAYRLAPRLQSPSLILQGTRDTLVTPAMTRRLMERLRDEVEYHEVNAEHNLLLPGQVAWGEVERHVLDFADRLKKRAT